MIDVKTHEIFVKYINLRKEKMLDYPPMFYYRLYFFVFLTDFRADNPCECLKFAPEHNQNTKKEEYVYYQLFPPSTWLIPQSKGIMCEKE